MAQYTKMATQLRERTIVGRATVANLTASPLSTIAALPEGFTQLSALRVSQGIFTFGYLKAFLRQPVVMAQAFHATLKLYPNYTTKACSGLTGCTIRFVDETGAVQDPTEVQLLVVGFDTADQQ